MTSGITFTLNYDDDDMVQLEIAACSGGFSGISYPYMDRDTLRTMASRLESFPTSITDEYVFEFSEFVGQEPSFLRFYIRDSAGHVAVQCRLHGGTANERCLSDFFVRTEVAQVNDAGKLLPRLATERDVEIIIRAIHHS
jgi:hypothetical protein